MTKQGLKLALTFIDSKLEHIQSFRLTSKHYDVMGKERYYQAEARLDGAASVLKDLRERIVRAIGPDDE